MKKLFTYQRKHLFPHPEATVAVRREFNQVGTAPHNHDFIELVVVVAGSALHRVGRSCHRLGPGGVFVINRRRSHAYEETDGLHIANILIREDFFERLHPSIGALPGYHTLFSIGAHSAKASVFESRTHLDEGTLAKVMTYLDAMEAESLRPEAGGGALAEAWLMLIIGAVSRCQPSRQAVATPAATSLGRLLSWLEKDCAKAISIADMAKVAAMSERTLLRRFRQATGQSPLGYLNGLRLRKARRLLENSGRASLTNDDVASRCGFENGNYLARRFRAQFGHAPQAWARIQGRGTG